MSSAVARAAGTGLPSPPHQYRPDVDGLRALAILPVVAFHAFPEWVPGGFVGVDVFFVISGYLISLIIFEGLARNRFTFSGFYARRIRRIFPALVLVLLTCLAWGWAALFADPYAALGKHVAAGAGFIANITLWREAGYFDTASDMKPVLHLWSLGIEEQFYLLWPSVLYVTWKWRMNPLIVIGLILFTSFAINVVQVRSDEIAAFYSPVTRLWELLLGAVLAYVGFAGPGSVLPRGFARLATTEATAIRNVAAVVGLLMIAAAVFTFDADTSFPGWRAGIPVGGAWLMIAAGPDAWLNRRVLSQRVLVWTGLISYPLYLWHWPLLAFARIAESGTPSTAVRLGIVGASVLLAWLTYAVVEKPVRFRWRGLAPVSGLCALMVLAGATGYWTYRSDGFIDRGINRSDTAHFLEYYARLKKTGLRAAYHAECDFMDWETETTRSAIDASCTQPGERSTTFLWGDSYAQALSAGLRAALPEGARLAQVTTSGCAPRLEEPDANAMGGRCATANAYARARIAAIKPDVVFVAQILNHADTDWATLASAIRALGARRVVLVGPAPQWLPSLPLVVTAYYWGQNYDRVSQGLNAEMMEIDRVLAGRYGQSPEVEYLSLIRALCNASGCLATVPGTEQLMAIDAGHLSPAGSLYVGETILRAHLPTREAQ